MTAADFYDRLAPFYHLIYPNWDASIQRQATALDAIIKDIWGNTIQTVLDVACGIGTQALGLAALGYTVTASDLSSTEVARAEQEAAARALHLSFSVADMREAYTHHQCQFDLVIACDNSVPHLLTDGDLLHAFQQFYACTRPGGGCLISVRDYDAEERAGVQVKPYGLRIEGQMRHLVFQVWEFKGDRYDLAMYLVEDHGGTEGVTHIMRTQYYAIGTNTLISLMQQAGFADVQRLDDRFYQPVIVGTRL
ncbi:MAG: methyltransferase domain-containing protein [Chloroflexota bacterium]|nr:methyltransferase domain-containing protein [Chloroflexota bacterium]